MTIAAFTHVLLQQIYLNITWNSCMWERKCTNQTSWHQMDFICQLSGTKSDYNQESIYILWISSLIIRDNISTAISVSVFFTANPLCIAVFHRIHVESVRTYTMMSTQKVIWGQHSDNDMLPFNKGHELMRQSMQTVHSMYRPSDIKNIESNLQHTLNHNIKTHKIHTLSE